jgi:hypothetical protein
MKRCITIMSDRRCRYYAIRSKKKEAQFDEWVAAVNGDKREYEGEDFSDYRIDRPLGTLVLTNSYRRFRQKRARLRGLRDIRDVRDN